MRVNRTIFYLEKKSQISNSNCKLIINEEIDLVSKPNFWDIIIDEHLEWKYHIDMCKRKISSGNYVLKSLHQY